MNITEKNMINRHFPVMVSGRVSINNGARYTYYSKNHTKMPFLRSDIDRRIRSR